METIKELETKVLELTKKYYNEVIPKVGHFKERDCHWLIEKKWSYDSAPVYVVVHRGYLYGDVEEAFTEEVRKNKKGLVTFSSYKKALLCLIGHLKSAIEEWEDECGNYK